MNLKENPIFKDAKPVVSYTGSHNVTDYLKATKPFDNVFVDFTVKVDQSKAQQFIDDGNFKPFDTTNDLNVRTYIKRDASNDRCYCRTFVSDKAINIEQNDYLLYFIGSLDELSLRYPFICNSNKSTPTETTPKKSKPSKKHQESPEDAAASLRQLCEGSDFI